MKLDYFKPPIVFMSEEVQYSPNYNTNVSLNRLSLHQLNDLTVRACTIILAPALERNLAQVNSLREKSSFSTFGWLNIFLCSTFM